MLRARERHPQRSLAEHYNPLSMDPILLKAHNNLDREVDKAFDVARKLTNERQRQELLFASYGELARGYVSSLSSKSKPPAGSFPVRVCVLSSCFRPFRLEFLGQFGTVLGRLSVAGVLRVIS